MLLSATRCKSPSSNRATALNSASHGLAACATMASNTGPISVGERDITLRISLVALWPAHASSRSSRSAAMVCRRSICVSSGIALACLHRHTRRYPSALCPASRSARSSWGPGASFGQSARPVRRAAPGTEYHRPISRMGADPLAAITALGPSIYHVRAKDTRLEPGPLARNGRIEIRPAGEVAQRACLGLHEHRECSRNLGSARRSDGGRIAAPFRCKTSGPSARARLPRATWCSRASIFGWPSPSSTRAPACRGRSAPPPDSGKSSPTPISSNFPNSHRRRFNSLIGRFYFPVRSN